MDFRNLTSEMKQLVAQNNYEILYDKAVLLKEKGINYCRQDDGFNFLNKKLSSEGKRIIGIGIKEIMNYKGLTLDNPFEGFTVSYFYFFTYIFQLEMKRQVAHHFDDYIIDKILFKNTSLNSEIWLYNKVMRTKENDEYIKKLSSQTES